jgi:RNA recognition motif-containing protein
MEALLFHGGPLWCDIPLTKREEKERMEYLTRGEGAEILSRVRKEYELLRRGSGGSTVSAGPSVPLVPRKSNTLILHNIPRDLTEDELRFEFGCYGTLRRIRIPRDKNPQSAFYGGVRGFAIVEFETAQQAETAATQESGRLSLRGKTITIEFVKP